MLSLWHNYVNKHVAFNDSLTTRLKTINPDDWKKLSSRLSDVRERMGELSDASKSLVEKYTNPQTMSFFRGELFIRFAELAGKALQKVKEFSC